MMRALYVSSNFAACDAPFTNTFPFKSSLDPLNESMATLDGIRQWLPHFFLRRCEFREDDEDEAVEAVDRLSLVRSDITVPSVLSFVIFAGNFVITAINKIVTTIITNWRIDPTFDIFKYTVVLRKTVCDCLFIDNTK